MSETKNARPASINNIAFDTGVLFEYKRIKDILESNEMLKKVGSITGDGAKSWAILKMIMEAMANE